MKIAIIGSGAIGLYYGALLQRSGNELYFLMRSDLEAARREGVRVLSQSDSFSLNPVSAFGDSSEIGVCDLAIVATKATSNAALEKLLLPVVGPETRILTLQNGLGNDEFLASLFPSNRVFGGLCFVCLNRVAPAVVRNFLPGSVILGPYRAADAEEGRSLARLFEAAGVKTRYEENLPLAQWKKLVWNIPFNGLSIAAGGVCTDVIVGTPELLEEAKSLMAEVIAVANAYGCAIEPSFIDYQVKLTIPMEDYRPSSMIDFVEGRPVELEAIFGEPLRRAKTAGVATPKLEMLYGLLKSLCAGRLTEGKK